MPRPGSVDAALDTLYAQLRPVVYQWAGEQRIEGSLQAHDSFDGLLTEHALALEEICRDISEGHVGYALVTLEREITHIRSLGTIAGPATDQEEKDAHED